SAPDPDLIRGIWALLPKSSRARLWPATYVFGNELHFDVLVTTSARGGDFAGYLTQEQVMDYPEGQYELNLQIAIEAGDQRALDTRRLRRSRRAALRLALVPGAAALILVLGMKLLLAAPPPARHAPGEPNPRPSAVQPGKEPSRGGRE